MSAGLAQVDLRLVVWVLGFSLGVTGLAWLAWWLGPGRHDVHHRR